MMAITEQLHITRYSSKALIISSFNIDDDIAWHMIPDNGNDTSTIIYELFSNIGKKGKVWILL